MTTDVNDGRRLPTEATSPLPLLPRTGSSSTTARAATTREEQPTAAAEEEGTVIREEEVTASSRVAMGEEVDGRGRCLQLREQGLQEGSEDRLRPEEETSLQSMVPPSPPLARNERLTVALLTSGAGSEGTTWTLSSGRPPLSGRSKSASPVPPSLFLTVS